MTTKKPTKRQGAADTAADVSDMTRRMVDAPGQALADSLKDQETWGKVAERLVELQRLAPDAFAAQQAELMAQIEPALRFMPFLLQRTIDRLKAGMAEAEAIRSHLERYEVGSLRAYLKEHPASPECLLWLLAENRRLALSLAASEAASMKNKPARDYVARAWADRADTGQSKASFARMIEHEVKRRFGVSVTPDRIARYWLPKG